MNTIYQYPRHPLTHLTPRRPLTPVTLRQSHITLRQPHAAP